VFLSIQIKRSSSILTARVDKVIFFITLTTLILPTFLKPDTINKDLKKCFNNAIEKNRILYTTIKFNYTLENNRILKNESIKLLTHSF
jgi:hypothetical protein